MCTIFISVLNIWPELKNECCRYSQAVFGLRTGNGSNDFLEIWHEVVNPDILKSVRNIKSKVCFYCHICIWFVPIFFLGSRCAFDSLHMWVSVWFRLRFHSLLSVCPPVLGFCLGFSMDWIGGPLQDALVIYYFTWLIYLYAYYNIVL